jgi:toxin ParE1/3/4
VKRRRIIFKHRARIDLTEIALHIAEFSPSAAARFIENARSDIARLCEFPGIGPTYGFTPSDLEDIHFLPITRYRTYLIFYRFDDQILQILRILSGRRDVAGELNQG